MGPGKHQEPAVLEHKVLRRDKQTRLHTLFTLNTLLALHMLKRPAMQSHSAAHQHAWPGYVRRVRKTSAAGKAALSVVQQPVVSRQRVVKALQLFARPQISQFLSDMLRRRSAALLGDYAFYACASSAWQ